MLKNSSKNSFQLRIIRSKSRGCARKADNLHKNQTIRKRIRRLYFIFFERKIDMQYHNIVDGDSTKNGDGYLMIRRAQVMVSKPRIIK